MMKKIKIAIVDDHKLFSKALESLISYNQNFEVIMNFSNGKDFLDTLQNSETQPEVVLMDINMPVKNGIETTEELTKNFPNIKAITLTKEDDENTIIQMMKAGAKGYLLKDISPEVLFDAIDIVHKNGIFYTDVITKTLTKIKAEKQLLNETYNDLKECEAEFVKLACSELSYKEIANKMALSPRTIDGYRESVFAKFNVKTRVGMVLFAVKNNLY